MPANLQVLAGKILGSRNRLERAELVQLRDAVRSDQLQVRSSNNAVCDLRARFPGRQPNQRRIRSAATVSLRAILPEHVDAMKSASKQPVRESSAFEPGRLPQQLLGSAGGVERDDFQHSRRRRRCRDHQCRPLAHPSASSLERGCSAASSFRPRSGISTRATSAIGVALNAAQVLAATPPTRRHPPAAAFLTVSGQRRISPGNHELRRNIERTRDRLIRAACLAVSLITEADCLRSTTTSSATTGTTIPEQMQPAYARLDGRLSLEAPMDVGRSISGLKNLTDK